MRPPRTPTPDLGRLQRPGLAAGVEVLPPPEPGAPWVVHRGTSYMRIGADLARLATALDGRTDTETLAAGLGAPWTPLAVEEALRTLDSAGLIEDGTPRRSHKRRVTFVPPLSVQLTLVRPGALLARLAAVSPRLADRRTRWLLGALVGAGVLALVAQSGGVVDALSTPLPWQSVLVLILAAGLATTVHEVSHGVALLQEGGRPTRIGVMLFYLVPAMFCDVSDAWRLPRPVQRVRVALAGVVTQGVIGATCALVALLPLPADVRAVVLVVALGNLGAGLLNLVPLIRLDGYIALMSHLDLPNLRTRCIDHARAVLAWVLLGGRRPRREPELPSWAAAFGVASVLFPVYLALSVLGLYVGLLSRTGLVGVLVLLAGAIYLLMLLTQAVVRLVRAGRSQGAGAARTAGALVALGAAAVLVLGTVQVPHRVAATLVTIDGAPLVVIPDGVAVPQISTGAEVSVATAGIVLTRHVATGEVTGAVDGMVEAPAVAFLPVTIDSDATLPAHAWNVRLDEGPVPTTAVATFDAGTLPLGVWLYRTYLAAGAA